ncbi:hypothetical protein [Leptospirillum ferrooxidans]|uniref:Uncharacterized protein n=1 Tax=Leptospirillum ferrooxidans (strain C2-3) TaxID=1162668 RepID=I0IQV9_LEPFC|nr:hypothetical protein [Leptospirillum ferrooxidans]BAM07658.1 hypothetical protein LFE_1983 [Leptospirillum ferrooxidans C2-3]
MKEDFFKILIHRGSVSLVSSASFESRKIARSKVDCVFVGNGHSLCRIFTRHSVYSRFSKVAIFSY